MRTVPFSWVKVLLSVLMIVTIGLVGLAAGGPEKAQIVFPSISVEFDTDPGAGTSTPVQSFNKSVKVQLSFRPYSNMVVNFKCRAPYPIKWVYNYNHENANYFNWNYHYQTSKVSREVIDFYKPSTYTYEARLGLLAHHSFKEAPEMYTCFSVANPKVYRTVEAIYEKYAPSPTPSGGGGNRTGLNGTEPSTTTTTSTTTVRTTTMTTYYYDPRTGPFNETLLLILVNKTNAEDLVDEAAVPPPGGTGSKCAAIFVVKESQGGANFPEWKCLSGSGAGSNSSQIDINFAYCHEGMTCENLFRTVKNQKESCVKVLRENETCSTDDNFKCITPQSFEPGVAYCSINGTVVAAQQFFYSNHPRAQLADNSSSPDGNLGWKDMGYESRRPYHGSYYGSTLFRIHFHWGEVDGNEMLRLDALKDGGLVTLNEELTVICRLSEYFFARGHRIGLEFNNRSQDIQFRPPMYGYYEQRTNALMAWDQFTVNDSSLTAVYCFGPIWNSSEWANVSLPISHLSPLAPSFKLNFEEINVYVGDPYFVLECNSNARPSPNVSWSKMYHGDTENEVLRRDYGNYYHFSGNNPTRNANVSFYNINFSQEGFYRCNVTNMLGSATKHFKVTVRAKTVPSFNNSVENVTLYVGDTGQTLSCKPEVRGDSMLLFLWWKEPVQGWDYERRTIQEWKFDGPIKSEDGGQYKCQAINPQGISLKEFNLKVQRPVSPRFSESDKTIELIDGIPNGFKEEIDICPSVSGDPKPNITLSKESGGWRPATKNKINPGNYLCTARNRFGSDTATVRVELTKPTKPSFKAPTERIRAKTNSSVMLACDDVQGFPVAETFTWYKDRTQITNLDPVNATTRLVINMFTKWDAGRYSCLARSLVGTATKTFFVDMEFSPSPAAPPTTTKPNSATPNGPGEPGKLNRKPSSSGASNASAIVITIVLLILFLVGVAGVSAWKYRTSRIQMSMLIRKNVPNVDESPDWHQMNSGPSNQL